MIGGGGWTFSGCLNRFEVSSFFGGSTLGFSSCFCGTCPKTEGVTNFLISWVLLFVELLLLDEITVSSAFLLSAKGKVDFFGSGAGFFRGNSFCGLGYDINTLGTASFFGPSSLIKDFFSSTGATFGGSTTLGFSWIGSGLGWGGGGCTAYLTSSAGFFELVISPVALLLNGLGFEVGLMVGSVVVVDGLELMITSVFAGALALSFLNGFYGSGFGCY